MPDEADISGKSYGDIDEEEYPCRAVFWVFSCSEFQKYIGEYCHSKPAYPDSVSTREEEEGNADKEGVQEKEEDKPVPSDKSFHLVSEEVEEKAIGKEVKNPSMKELIEEKLDDKPFVRSPSEEKCIHTIHEDILSKKRHSCEEKRKKDENVRETFI